MYLLASSFNIPVLIASGFNPKENNIIFLTNKKSTRSIILTANKFGICKPIIVTNKLLKFLFILTALLQSKVILGDTRSKWVRSLIYLKRSGSVTVVDDGTNTITAFTETKFRLLVERKKACVKTIFNIDHQSCDNIKTQFLRVLKDIPKLDIQPRVKIILLGTCEFERGNISLTNVLHELSPYHGTTLYYKAHRNESNLLFDELKEHFDIERLYFDMPIEFYDLSRIRNIIAFGSTAIPILNELYPELTTTNLGHLIETKELSRTQIFASNIKL